MCCGRNRAQLNTRTATKPMTTPSKAPDSTQEPPRVPFMYVGNTAMTVTGPISGTQYRFNQPGSTLDIDARDRILLASIRQLRQIS
jgi:hypothetical protein